MSKVYKATEWKDLAGNIRIQCDDLVGTGRNWSEPAKILGMKPSDFLASLKEDYEATLVPYRNKEGKLTFVGYHWKSLQKARLFKNKLNKIAREKNYKI